MAQLRDVVAYLCKRYPHKQELSKARLSKMIYLGEFRSATTKGRRLTDQTWTFSHLGPYLGEMDEFPFPDESFRVTKGTSIYGDPMEVVTVLEDVEFPSLTEEDRRILDLVVKESAAKEWEDLCSLVCSTIPAIVQATDTRLDWGGARVRGSEGARIERQTSTPKGLGRSLPGGKPRRRNARHTVV